MSLIFILNKLSQKKRNDRLVYYEHAGKYDVFDIYIYKFENPLKIPRSYSNDISD